MSSQEKQKTSDNMKKESAKKRTTKNKTQEEMKQVYDDEQELFRIYNEHNTRLIELKDISTKEKLWYNAYCEENKIDTRRKTTDPLIIAMKKRINDLKTEAQITRDVMGKKPSITIGHCPSICGIYHTLRYKHTCHLKPSATETMKIRTIKRALASTLTNEGLTKPPSSTVDKNPIIDNIDAKVFSVHRATFLASRLLNLFAIDQSIIMHHYYTNGRGEGKESKDSISEEKKIVTHFEQFELSVNTIKKALRLCSVVTKYSKESDLNTHTGLVKVFQDYFVNKFPSSSLPNVNQLTNNALSAAAEQMMVNFNNYMKSTFHTRHYAFILIKLWRIQLGTLPTDNLNHDDVLRQDSIIKSIVTKICSLIYDYSVGIDEDEVNDEEAKKPSKNEAWMTLRTALLGKMTIGKLLPHMSKKSKQLYAHKTIEQVMSTQFTLPTNREMILQDIEEKFHPAMRNFRNQISSKGNKEQSTPFRWWVPWMHHMASTLFQRRKVKQYSLFPLTAFIPGHITMNPDLLCSVVKSVKEKDTTMNNVPYLERTLFSFTKNKDKNWWTHNNRCFRNIVTDGVAVSFVFERIVPKKELPVHNQEDEEENCEEVDNDDEKQVEKDMSMNLPPNIDRLLAIDPNRRNVFGAVSRFIRGPRIHEKDQAIIMSNAEWQQARGVKKSNLLHERRLARNPVVATVMQNIPSSKTSDLHTMIKHINYLSTEIEVPDPNFSIHEQKTKAKTIKKSHLHLLLDYYQARRFRRMRFECYMKQQASWTNTLLKKLQLTTKKDREQSIVILGDGSFDHASYGHAPSPTSQTLYQELKKRGVNVYYQNEFRTSKLCSHCQTVLVPIVHKNTDADICKAAEKEQNRQDKYEYARRYAEKHNTRPPTPLDPPKPLKSTRTPWGIRQCPHSLCNKTWNRDINACINMLNLFIMDCLLSSNMGITLPPYLLDSWRTWYKPSVHANDLKTE